MRNCSSLGLALASLVFLGSTFSWASAEAQWFGADRAAREGPGFKVGRMVLHPGLALEGGYDSNVFLSDENEEGSFILRVEGYLDVATEGEERRQEGDSANAEPQKITFRGGLGGRYYHYFFGRVPDNVGADAHIDFSYNPSRVFSLKIRDFFTRTVRPFSNANTLQGRSISYGRNVNTGSIDLVGRSRSQVVEGRVGYTNVIEFFDASIYNYGNNLTHRVPVSLSWLFFPTSALVYEMEYANQRFLNPGEVLTSPTLLSPNNRVSNLIGYNGALTERFSLTAMIGYAFGLYKIGDDYDDVIARIDTRWQPRPTVALIAGYERDVRPSFIGNFATINRLYANALFTVGGALQLGIRAWASRDRSGLALSPDGTLLGNEPNRKDWRVSAGIFGEYRFLAWLALFAQVGWLADFTDFRYVGPDPLLDPPARYQRFDAWIGVRVFY